MNLVIKGPFCGHVPSILIVNFYGKKLGNTTCMDHEKIYLHGFYPRSLISAFVNILLLKCPCILPRLDTGKIFKACHCS